jgi:hypothetical protein
MRKLLALSVLVLPIFAGCGGSEYDSYDSSGFDSGITDSDLSEYASLQESWDEEDIETQVNVCMAIDIDPSLARSTAIENDVDPDVAEAFFEEVCP